MNTGASNVRRAVVLLVACFQMSAAAATEYAPDVGVTDVLYASASEWQQSTAERKISLSASIYAYLLHRHPDAPRTSRGLSRYRWQTRAGV